MYSEFGVMRNVQFKLMFDTGYVREELRIDCSVTSIRVFATEYVMLQYLVRA